MRVLEVRNFIADQVERHKPNIAATRYRALQQFFKWLAEEGEVAASPMVEMRAPMVPESPPPILRDDEIRRLLKACEGSDVFARRRREHCVLRVARRFVGGAPLVHRRAMGAGGRHHASTCSSADGFDGYLSKPIDTMSFARTVEAYLGLLPDQKQ